MAALIRRLVVLAALLILTALFWTGTARLARAAVRRVTPPAPSSAPRTELAVYRAGQWDAPIVHYDAATLTLTVSPHAPRALLICIRDRCDLAEGWIGK